MGSRRQESILESQLVLVIAQGLRIAMGLAVTVILVRCLDETGFAAFVLITAAMMLAGQLVDAGLQPAVIGELVKDAARGRAFMHRVMRRRLVLAVGALGVAWLRRDLLPAATNW